MAGVCRSISKNVCLILIIYLSFGGTSIGYCKSLSFAARENYFASQILVANDKHATTVTRSKDGLNISNVDLLNLQVTTAVVFDYGINSAFWRCRA